MLVQPTQSGPQRLKPGACSYRIVLAAAEVKSALTRHNPRLWPPESGPPAPHLARLAREVALGVRNCYRQAGAFGQRVLPWSAEGCAAGTAAFTSAWYRERFTRRRLARRNPLRSVCKVRLQDTAREGGAEGWPRCGFTSAAALPHA